MIGYKRKIFSMLLFLTMLWVPYQGLQAEGRLFLLQGDTLHVFSGQDGSDLGQQVFPGANLLVPTPGGKYVFVVNSKDGVGYAVDFENPGSWKELDFSEQAPLRQIVFSPKGDTVLAVSATSAKIAEYAHRSGEIERLGELPIKVNRSDTGIAFNTRGTRIYHRDGKGLGYYLRSDGTLIKRIDDVKDGTAWQIAPGGRNLWAISPAGWVIVDEPKADVKKVLKGKSVSSPVFDLSGRGAWALSDSGKTLVQFNVRRQNITGTAKLPFVSFGLAIHDQEGVWLVSDDQLYHVPDIDTPPKSVGKISGSGEMGWFVAVRLKPNQGFACF